MFLSFINAYDIIYLCETHCSKGMKIMVDGYKAYDNPCQVSKIEKPRGGAILYVKKNISKHIVDANVKVNDTIVLHMNNHTVLCGIYIPPRDSPYFSNQFEFLDSIMENCNNFDECLIVFGDLNCRIGENTKLLEFNYGKNPDKTVNANGQKLLSIIREKNFVILNHLQDCGNNFNGDYTFSRGDVKSQIDWILINKSNLHIISDFNVIQRYPEISDHKPVSCKLNLNVSIPLETTIEILNDVLYKPNNHSKVRKVKADAIDKDVFKNLAVEYINNSSSDERNPNIEDIEDAMKRAAQLARIKEKKSGLHIINSVVSTSLESQYTLNELKTWKAIEESRDAKTLWRKIDWQGKINNELPKSKNSINEYADYLEQRCSLPVEHSLYNDIETNVFNPITDSRITEAEVRDCAYKMKRNSASKDRIPVQMLLILIPSILSILSTAFNNIFIGVTKCYPPFWKAMMKCLPKKGKLNILNFRAIGLKPVLAKLYDSILLKRLTRWLQIPEEQTAYQKEKGCYMHVFFIRALIAIAVKKKTALFIGISDFTAAFDSISRRILFQKLIHLGVGAMMLNALKEMYNEASVFVEMNGEYSKEFDLRAGVLQGAATSTILFIAYTADLVALFRNIFDEEDLIYAYHLLVHADDALLLATQKLKLLQKFQALENYCNENKISLQLTKCSFMSINSNEKDPIQLKEGVIKNSVETLYLGSVISESGNINQDIKMEIRSKEKGFNKFFAFLHSNYNAPLKVKLKVLNSCLYSSVLYNCETWGNVNTKPLEKKYCKTLKYILGVRSQVCNEFAYIELGIPTLQSVILSRQHKFYNNVIKNKDWPLLRYIVNQGRMTQCKFIEHYDSLVESNMDGDEIKRNSVIKLQEEIKRKAEQGKSRYVTYMEVNPTLSKPNIYEKVMHTSKLHKLTRLRTGSHTLAIETGRHTRPIKPREERLCDCNQVEDESHFLLKCYKYRHIREKYKINEYEMKISDILQMDFVPDYITELEEVRELYKN